jgi:hypothetical protein
VSRIRDNVFLFEGANEDRVMLVRNVTDKVKNLIERVQMQCRPDTVIVRIVSRFLSVFVMLYRKPQYQKLFATSSNVYIYIYIYIYVCVCVCLCVCIYIYIYIYI